MTEEEWRAVVGWEGLYEVSSLGRVRSLSRSLVRTNGSPFTVRGETLKGSLTVRGYYVVTLYGVGEPARRNVHRLVAEAFIPNPDNLPVVRHMDDIKTDNSVANLAWGTQGDNIRDIVRNGNFISYWGSRTECKWNHEYTEENTYLDPRGRRRCRTCRKAEYKRGKRDAGSLGT